MKAWHWVVFLGLLAGAVFVGYVVTRRDPKEEITATCAGLRAQIAAMRVQGGDLGQLAILEAQLMECTRTAERLGVDVDAAEVKEFQCDGIAQQMRQEWSHYRSTSYADPLKRENTRTAILRMGDDLARCFEESIAEAKTIEEVDRIYAKLKRARDESEARAICFEKDQSGCGRFGVSEPHGNDKARDERERVLAALMRASRAAVDRKGEIAKAALKAALQKAKK